MVKDMFTINPSKFSRENAPWSPLHGPWFDHFKYIKSIPFLRENETK